MALTGPSRAAWRVSQCCHGVWSGMGARTKHCPRDAILGDADLTNALLFGANLRNVDLADARVGQRPSPQWSRRSV
jgi:hypothetical protein